MEFLKIAIGVGVGLFVGYQWHKRLSVFGLRKWLKEDTELLHSMRNALRRAKGEDS